MKRTALIMGTLGALTLLGGCAADGDYYGGSGYYGGSYGYYDGYGPDYYPGGYGYAYIPRGGYGGGYRGHGDRDHDRGRGRDYHGGDGPRPGQGPDGGGRGNWNGGDRGAWNRDNGVSQAARDADRAAHPQSFNADGERITRGNFWRQNQGGMNAPQQAAPSPPPSGDGGGRGFRGRRGDN